MKLLKSKIFLILIVLLMIGFFLRVYRLSEVPLYGDELTIILDAQSILENGVDQTGESFPLTFSMGAGRPGGYVYGSIPFVALFGLNEWGVRGLSILSGLVNIFLMYFLGRRLFNQNVGIIAAFLYTFSFWDINLSRGGYEAHFALMLSLLGIISLLFSESKKWLFIVAGMCFGLTFHTYPTYKLVLPLFLIGLFIYLRYVGQKTIALKNRFVYIGSIIFIMLACSALLQTFVGGSENRFLTINVFSDSEIQKGVLAKVNEERSASSLPNSLKTLFHNKGLEYIKIVGENYFTHFSPEFLFLYGDRNPRHNMSTMGYFYLFELGTLFCGFIFLFLKRFRRVGALMLFWISVAPLATAIVSTPHGLRSAFLLPPLILISALGVSEMFQLLNRKKLLALQAVILVLFVGQFIYFGSKEYFLAPTLFGRFWAESGKLATIEALDKKSTYSHLIISDKIDSIEYAYPVYGKVKSTEVITQHPKKEELFGQSGFKRFDNVYIGNLSLEMAKREERIYYIGPIEDTALLEEYITIKNRKGVEILVAGIVKN